MVAGKDEPRGEIGECDISCAWDRPSCRQIGTVHNQRLKHVQTGRPGDSACGCEYRHRRFSRRFERTTWQRRLENLLHRQREEEDHPDVVDDEVNRPRKKRIRRIVDVRPRETSNGPSNEQQRSVEYDGPQPRGRRRCRIPRHSSFWTLRKFESTRASSGLKLMKTTTDPAARICRSIISRARGCGSSSALSTGTTPHIS